MEGFRHSVGWLWWRSLKRRGQSHHLPWRRMEKHVQRWLPPARICHPWPGQRLRVTTRGKSRMRWRRKSGSVEGVISDGHSYSD